MLALFSSNWLKRWDHLRYDLGDASLKDDGMIFLIIRSLRVRILTVTRTNSMCTSK